jgi:hypothetical protein
MADIFVSYAREDAPMVDGIARALRARGFSVFSDRELVTGALLQEQIQREIESARLVLLVLSRHASKSRWVQQEIISALEADRDRPVLPLLIDDEATENVLWPLVANRPFIRETSADALPGLVVSAASRLLSPSASAVPLRGRWRALVFGSSAGILVTLLAGLLIWNQRLANPEPDVVNLTPSGAASAPPAPAASAESSPPRRHACRLPEHGIENWAKTQQWTADSDWRKGGSSPQEFCSQQLQARKSQYPDRETRVLSFGERHKSEYTPFKHDFYRYTCVLEDRWEPIYKEAQSNACPPQ